MVCYKMYNTDRLWCAPSSRGTGCRGAFARASIAPLVTQLPNYYQLREPTPSPLPPSPAA